MKHLSTVKKFKFVKFISLAIAILFISNITQANKLDIKITGLKSNDGYIRLAIYDKAKDFPKNGEYYKLYKIKISNKTSKLTINNLPAGDYAIAIMHDKNNNKKMDKNMMGIPKEGFGFSNNPKIVFKEPSFNECKISMTNQPQSILIKMIHF